MKLFGHLIRPILTLFCCSLTGQQRLPLVIQTPNSPNIEPIPEPSSEGRVKAQQVIPRIEIPDSATEGTIGNGHLTPKGWSANRPSRGDSLSSNKSSDPGSSVSTNSASDDSLSARLRLARIECPRRQHYWFVPMSALEELITAPNIERDIHDRIQNIEPGEIKHLAKKISLVAPKMFAILAYMKKGAEICSLLKDGLSDDDLPLKRKANGKGEYKLFRKPEVPIETFEHWSDRDVEDFDRYQYWMIAPVFEDRGHYELEDSHILPFMPYETTPETEKKHGGSYSVVYVARIHPAHHKFWGRTESRDAQRLVAVKRLLSSDPIEFEKEVSILKALASKPKHPHLITLLATFLHKNKYHLIFPYADANLRKYWDDRPKPAFDQITVLWSLKQMSGIANALSQIHNFTVSHPLSVVGAGELRIQNDVRLSVQKEEQIYGRHGDIKPENVLWFKTAPESEDEHGVLQIADFGLGRFHGRDSRSKVPWEEVLGSPTYEPPECKLHRPVSRAYDIWSLGCLYLEFITWLLKGSADIEGFSDFRGKLAISTQINDDNFFTIVKDSHSELEAVVRKEVVTWVQQLHQHEKCSAVIHDILELIMRDVLLIDSTERIESRNLHQTLETYLEKAIKDNDYLLKPAPKFELSQSNPKNLKVNKGKSVAFSGQEENSASSSAHQSRLPPILLIPRTPSPLGKDKPHHTWPPHGPGIG